MSERFGPYRLVRRLATGGMAEVFLAVHTGIEGFEREVVIKRILPHRAQNAEFSTMFLDEARLVARLGHPHIAQMYDLGRVEDTYFIAMEYVHGVDLAQLLDVMAEHKKNDGLPAMVAIPVLGALCEALHYIHTRSDELGNPLNIVHRDLNPKNIIISYDGAVKLIDFGIAKATSQVYETRTGVIKGTYGYMAPEQVTKKHSIDARADLFALGVVAYELTTGRHPFDGHDEVEILTKLVRCDFSEPSKVVRGYSAELERILLSLLSADPSKRPKSARNVLTWLESYSVRKGIPMTLSRIADFVRAQVPPVQEATQLPAPVSNNADSTAKMSARLAQRANSGTADLATAFLRGGPEPVQKKPAPEEPTVLAKKAPTVPVRPPPKKKAPASSGAPWAGWSGRQKAIGLAGLMIVAVGALFAGILLAEALGVGGAVPDVLPEPQQSQTTAIPNAPDASATVTPQPNRAEGGLLVRSDPPGARIVIEGRETGQITPAEIPVPLGQSVLWIGVRLEGYQPESRGVEATAGVAVFSLTPLASSHGVAPPQEDG